jgi:hypothetical protein
MSTSWRANRLALIVAALALLAATPSILAAAGVRDSWVLAGATAAAAVIVVFSAVWQERYRRQVRRDDKLLAKVRAGSLLRNGDLPKVRDITDPVELGVHRAGVALEPRDGRPTVTEHVPDFVPRDIDAELDKHLEVGGFVLLVGDSTAGKSRAAFEAMRARLADHVLIYPSPNVA